MKTRWPLALFVFLLLFMTSKDTIAQTQSTGARLPAFPGAEGFGATTPGGRGGRVIKVTNLNGSGPGSLQAACNARGPRIVVFDTCGVIRHEVQIQHGRITIMGQTAPSPGITVRGILSTNPYLGYLDDIVVRFLRVRPDSSKALNDMGDGMEFPTARNSVIDHCSFSWASDETVAIFRAQDITVQWCTIEESDTEGHWKGRHNYGMISGPDGIRTSIHHNLFAHHSRRNPAVANGPCDVRNNLVYNFRDGFLHDNPTNDGIFNIVGNYYKPGPSSARIFPFCFQDTTYYYLRDNFIEGVGLIQDPWAEADKLEGLSRYARRGTKSDKPAQVPAVTTHDPREVFRLVLEQAGCFPRDAVSRRTIEEVKSGTGRWGRRDPGDLNAGLPVGRAPADSDDDGMPDAWEKANMLNPADSSDHTTVMQSGYTAIEEYCNQLAEELIGSGQK